jgi:hypothetical protein
MCLSQVTQLTFMREEESAETLLELPTPQVRDALQGGSATKSIQKITQNHSKWRSLDVKIARTFKTSLKALNPQAKAARFCAKARNSASLAKCCYTSIKALANLWL